MEKAIWDWIAIERRCGFRIPDEDVLELIARVKAAADKKPAPDIAGTIGGEVLAR